MKNSAEHNKIILELNSKNWKIVFKDGKEIIIKNLKKWCNENEIYYHSCYRKINTKYNEFKIYKIED
jgi:hypothetical protein